MIILLTQSDVVWRLAIAAVLGAVLGLDRSLTGKHAGMRTFALVAMGSCLFVIVGTLSAVDLSRYFASVNPVQIASNVVVAIGFLGIGLTVFRGDHPVELTTAAGLWVAAGIGMATGFGFWEAAAVATVLGVLVFSFLAKVERALSARLGIKHEE